MPPARVWHDHRAIIAAVAVTAVTLHPRPSRRRHTRPSTPGNPEHPDVRTLSIEALLDELGVQPAAAMS